MAQIPKLFLHNQLTLTKFEKVCDIQLMTTVVQDIARKKDGAERSGRGYVSSAVLLDLLKKMAENFTYFVRKK